MRTLATEALLSPIVERDDSAVHVNRLKAAALRDSAAPNRHRGCQPLLFCGG